MFRKTRKANCIKTSRLFPDFRLKYCGKEVFSSQATLAINVSTFLAPSKIPKTIANKTTTMKTVFFIFVHFPADLVFQGSSGRHFFWEHIFKSIFRKRGRGAIFLGKVFFHFFLFFIFFPQATTQK